MELDLNLQNELINAIASLHGESTWIYSPAAVALVSGFVAIMGSLLTQYFNLRGKKEQHENDEKIKNIESDIRKQENIQNLQLDALSKLSEINNYMQPNIWSTPNYDSHNAYSEVVFNMSNLLEKLNDFLNSYSYIIPSETITHLNNVLFLCNETHWSVSSSDSPYYEPDEKEINAAKTVIDNLSTAVEELKGALGVTAA